jgi:hypothetical protein
MNTKRLLLAFVAALVVAYLYEYLVYGIALQSFHAAQARWLKPQADLPMLRMFLTLGVGIALLTVFYALFARRGAANVGTGLLFGVFIGLIAGWMPQVYNKMLIVDWPFYKAWAPAGLGEFVVIGLVLGLTYRNQ